MDPLAPDDWRHELRVLRFHVRENLKAGKLRHGWKFGAAQPLPAFADRRVGRYTRPR